MRNTYCQVTADLNAYMDACARETATDIEVERLADMLGRPNVPPAVLLMEGWEMTPEQAGELLDFAEEIESATGGDEYDDWTEVAEGLAHHYRDVLDAACEARSR